MTSDFDGRKFRTAWRISRRIYAAHSIDIETLDVVLVGDRNDCRGQSSAGR
jgi:hypothetical protein